MNLSKMEGRLKVLESRIPKYSKVIWLEPGESIPDEPGLLTIRWGRDGGREFSHAGPEGQGA